MAPRDKLPLRSFAEFAEVLAPFLDLCRTGALSRATAWKGGPPAADPFFNLDNGYFLRAGVPFQPFAQRLEVPPGSRVLMQGDLHGDIHSLIAYLELLNKEGELSGFRVIRPETRLVFLGDYTDRGRHGVEVLYTLLRLKLANPDAVFLVRGNHEDVSLVGRYGFLAEATGKFGREFDARRVVRLYEFLPAVLYLSCGTNVVQCNHGGLEPGFQPGALLDSPPPVTFELLGALRQRGFQAAQAGWLARQAPGVRKDLNAYLTDFVPESPTTPAVLGFLWNDFTVVAGEAQFSVDPGRAYVYGDEITRLVLAQASTSAHRVRAIFRGHQHAPVLNPLMRRLLAARGITRHWQPEDNPGLLNAAPEVLQGRLETRPDRPIPDGSVWTFNVTPDSVYGAGCGFGFSAFGEVRTAERWEEWNLKVRNIEVVKDR